MNEKASDNKSAVETMLNWKYNPCETERKVEERSLTQKEKELIKENNMVKKKIKVFISQPMAIKTIEEIENEREVIIKNLTKKYGEGNYEIIDSFIIRDVPNDAKPLWFLGKSLEFLSTADAAIFAKGWDKARGCIIEHIACEKYGIPIWEM